MGMVNTGYSRRAIIMKEYLKVKSCSQGWPIVDNVSL
jgi:hypothetical protein